MEKEKVELQRKINLEVETIREELNVKKLELAENPDAIAEKSVVVNARAAGKKFGAKIQKPCPKGQSRNKLLRPKPSRRLLLKANFFSYTYYSITFTVPTQGIEP